MSEEMPPSLKESVEHSKCEYKRLGKTGLKISLPIMGAMSFGNANWMPWVLDEEEALPLIKAAYDRGLNTWDTANVYSAGYSEICIGKAIKKYDIPRQKVLIFTKCHFTVAEELPLSTVKYSDEISKSRDYVNQRGNQLSLLETQKLNEVRTFTRSDLQRCGRLPEAIANRLYRPATDPPL